MGDNFLVCPKCKKRSYVSVQRNSPYDTGWGCLNCQTAVKTKKECSICGETLDIYTRAGVKLKKFICEKCLEKLNSQPVIFFKNIPTWRLNLDDASPYEVITKPLSTFGTPFMSEQKWKEFYNQPHELERKRQVEEEKKRMRKEAIRELIEAKEK